MLTIDPPTPERAIEILRGIATRYEAHHNVQIGDPAIVAAVRLAKRYVQDRALPDTAIDLLDEAAARKRVEIDGVPAHVDDAIRRVASLKAQLAGARGRRRRDEREDARAPREGDRASSSRTVSEMRAKLDSRRGALAAQAALREEMTEAPERSSRRRARSRTSRSSASSSTCTLPDVKRRLDAADAAVDEGGPHGRRLERRRPKRTSRRCSATGPASPSRKMLEAESEKLLKMEERLAARVVGQDEAVRAVVDGRAPRARRPARSGQAHRLASSSSGPSGVGKTELAKALAEFLFDDEQSMTRLDMSEFMEKHMAQRLVGAPPGYVDSEEGGFLTEAVRRRPYSVLLFDEVEKAHADVFNLLLQVLDDGRLTDGRGRTADFSNTVVIMTSNIGSQRILETDAEALRVRGRPRGAPRRAARGAARTSSGPSS